MSQPDNMRDNVIVVDSGFDARVVPVTDTLWSDIDAEFGDFAGRTLISRFEFDGDWPTWEVHPAGDEFVYLLSGKAELILATADGDRSVPLGEPGEFVIVPKNTWHTARISEPTAMLFVTPGEGTINAEEPDRSNNG
jgi:mannose-6-phosphate isomerase-like protein (cupin superfamily)